MPDTPPRRRHRTRQRERVLEHLRSTGDHPTAGAIHAALAPELPGLSLGTVYRNLEVLVEEGEVDEVPVPGGPSRYDGNTGPHHHFVCESCGGIEDLAISVPVDLAARVRRRYRLKPRRYRIDFFGLCRACTGR